MLASPSQRGLGTSRLTAATAPFVPTSINRPSLPPPIAFQLGRSPRIHILYSDRLSPPFLAGLRARLASNRALRGIRRFS